MADCHDCCFGSGDAGFDHRYSYILVRGGVEGRGGIGLSSTLGVVYKERMSEGRVLHKGYTLLDCVFEADAIVEKGEDHVVLSVWSGLREAGFETLLDGLACESGFFYTEMLVCQYKQKRCNDYRPGRTRGFQERNLGRRRD